MSHEASFISAFSIFLRCPDQGVDVKLNLGGKYMELSGLHDLGVTKRAVTSCSDLKAFEHWHKKHSFRHLRNAMVKEVEPEKVHLKTKARRARASGTDRESTRHDFSTRHLI